MSFAQGTVKLLDVRIHHVNRCCPVLQNKARILSFYHGWLGLCSHTTGYETPKYYDPYWGPE